MMIMLATTVSYVVYVITGEQQLLRIKTKRT
jgi:hypothetical protein